MLISNYSSEIRQQITDMFNHGETQERIGEILGLPRRTVGKICKSLGLKRSVKEAAELKCKSPLDEQAIVVEINELRRTHSLEEIAAKFNSSTSAVHRICQKHEIPLPADFATLQASRMRQAWTDDKREVAATKATLNVTEELRKALSDNSKALWQKPEYRQKQIEVQTAYWNKEENRARLATFRANQSGRISSIQKLLYSLLDDLKVEYQPEFVIGPFNFDCLIPRPNKSILVECQGDYWHSLAKAIRTDKGKATYVQKYHDQTYELKYIWEHEFFCLDKVSESLKHWLGITAYELVDFDFTKDVTIRPATAEEYRPLLCKYHYLADAGRYGQAFGAYVGEELVAVCVFSSLVRQNIDTGVYQMHESRELSRLCINPRYQKKNFASWFTSRCMKLLDKKIRLIISYCDKTFNHDGAVYKALNFKQDSIIRPDYWYVDERGWVMHKKTLYQRASKMTLKEAEYADQFGYKKVFGSEKIKFTFER